MRSGRLLRGLAGPLLAVAAVALGGPAAAQEYPPPSAEVGCSATVVEPDSDVTCGAAPGTFQAGTTVDATLSSPGGQASGAPALAAITLAPLAQGRESFTLTRQVTAAEDGSAQTTFHIPADAVLGTVTVVFEGTGPDGSPVRVSQSGAFRVVAGDGGDGLPDTGTDVQPLVWGAVVLLVAGGMWVWFVRRRGEEREETPVG